MTVDRLWAAFEERISALGGRVSRLEDLKSLGNRTIIADEDCLALLPFEWQASGDIWKADVGITLAEKAIAESGSLLLSAGKGRRRMASLAPEIHVCLVPRASIVQTLEEGLASIPVRNSVLITGSSRTADIEGVLVRGVHGPREVWVVPFEPKS